MLLPYYCSVVMVVIKISIYSINTESVGKVTTRQEGGRWKQKPTLGKCKCVCVIVCTGAPIQNHRRSMVSGRVNRTLQSSYKHTHTKSHSLEFTQGCVFSVTPLPVFLWYFQLSVKLSPSTCHLNASWHEWWESRCMLYTCCGHTLTQLQQPRVANMILVVRSYKPVTLVLMFIASMFWREFPLNVWQWGFLPQATRTNTGLWS